MGSHCGADTHRVRIKAGDTFFYYRRNQGCRPLLVETVLEATMLQYFYMFAIDSEICGTLHHFCGSNDPQPIGVPWTRIHHERSS